MWVSSAYNTSERGKIMIKGKGGSQKYTAPPRVGRSWSRAMVGRRYETKVVKDLG